jgi:hypothetical protein
MKNKKEYFKTEVLMNKRRFLFVLPICLIFCFALTTCEEEYKDITDLWDNLRNTAWVNNENSDATEGCPLNNGKSRTISTTIVSRYIGFYGPQKGPFPASIYSSSSNPSSSSDNLSAPYVARRIIYRLNNELPADALPDFKSMWINNERSNRWPDYGMQIDRTGNEISITIRYTDENSNIQKRILACKVTVNGNKLTVKRAKKHDMYLDEGTYTKVSSDPNYQFN